MTEKATTSSLPRERRMLDRYELIAQIARGGMGTVMLARLEGAGGFQRFFAIKVMHPHLAEDRQFVHMLLDEARLAARIHHPNVVATVDVCESKLGYYLVMDWVEGFTLAQIVDHPKLAASDRIRIANRILLDAMAGLDAAHNLRGDDGASLGIVHRDVSPQNILVGLDGVGRITDFGVALAASRITSSRPGIIKGKPAYMAPEQARGEALDRRADVFALGVMLWESLAGKSLFLADTDAGTVYRVIHAPIERPRELVADLPEALEAACLHALERDPAARTPTARAMASEVTKAAEPAGLVASSHEVAEKLAELFAEEIAERRASIREHLATLGTTSAPAIASDVFDVPKLRRTPTEPPIDDEAALAATKAAKTPGGLATTLRERPPTADGKPIPTTRELVASESHPPPLPARLETSHDPSKPALAVEAAATEKIPRVAEAPPGLSSRVVVVWAVCVALALVGTVWLVARISRPVLPRPAAIEEVAPRPAIPAAQVVPRAEPPVAPAPTQGPPTTTAPAEPPATPAATSPADPPTASPAPTKEPVTPARPAGPTRPGKATPLEVEANPYR